MPSSHLQEPNEQVPAGTLKRLGRGVLDLLYPPCCLLCQEPMPRVAADAFCADCLLRLPTKAQAACPRCAMASAAGYIPNADCPHCRIHAFAFSRAISWGTHEGLLRDAILRLKQARGEPLAAPLARLFHCRQKTRLAELAVDAIVPVPLHWTRRLWRGYNQAHAVARELANQLGQPCHAGWLWRVRQTPHQVGLPVDARRRNLRRAFRASIPRRWESCRILLVDDVMTTGSTAHACARALVRAGAGEVCVAVLARATGAILTGDRSGTM